jgi:3-deoxy-D-manno-octulosonic-acid transferase
MYLLYSALLALAVFLGLPVWLMKMTRHGKYRAGLGERFGRVPKRIIRKSGRGAIWVHAVSVGEVLAVTGLLKQMQQRWPARRIVVSTTTATGQQLARSRFGAENVCYFPVDFAFAIRPYLRTLRPELVVLAETEFWPNFLRLVHASGARIVVVNARISDRSFPRYRRFRSWMKRILGAIDLFLAQSNEDAQRLVQIGAEPEHVQVSGNLKFDMAIPSPPPIVADLRAAIEQSGAGPVIVAGSTVEGEEPLVIGAFRRVLEKYPNALLILAARHPERFGQVADLFAASGLKFWRRSQWGTDRDLRGGIFLLDTIGELASLYALADVAFVGGSLVARGGHNILEPAEHGAPTIVGSHTENFRDIISLFQRANAVIVVPDAPALRDAFLRLLADPAECHRLGERGRELVCANAGATARTLDAIAGVLNSESREMVRP